MPRLQQFLLAVVFLTRLPLGRLLPARVMGLCDSLWAFAIVGAGIGAMAAIPLLLPGPALLIATLSVVISVVVTGALHEDALGDFCDAAGGRDRVDRLRIMRESTIGSYGTVALILVTALRIGALTATGPWALIAAAAIGRAAIVPTMALLPPARSEGLGHGAGRPGHATIAVTLGLAVLFAAPLGSIAGLTALALAAISTGFVIRTARRWLGGQTGDVLGTVSISAETIVLTGLALMGHKGSL